MRSLRATPLCVLDSLSNSHLPIPACLTIAPQAIIIETAIYPSALYSGFMENELDLNGLLQISKPQFVPPLHPTFTPAALCNRNFQELVRSSGRAVPLVIGIERGDHSISVYRTQCLDEGSESAGLNLFIAD